MEKELNKTVRLLDWVIVEPEIFETLTDDKDVWVLNKIRLLAVEMWLENIGKQVDTHFTKEELQDFNVLRESLQTNVCVDV